jgi:hypothetical protein
MGVLLACAALLAAPPAAAQDYPRLSLYGDLFYDGWPLLDANGDPDPAVLDMHARHHVVILTPYPITPHRPELAAEIRARRPDVRLLSYVNGHYTWFPQVPDSLNEFASRYKRLVRDLDGFLYNQYGETFGSRVEVFVNVNLAKRDAGGRLVVAEALADLFYQAVYASGTWDGLFIDTICDDVLWAQGYGETIDLARAGYPDWNSFAAGWRAGVDTLANRTRRLCGNAAIISGNCGSNTRYAQFNGWMRERFPFQGGGNWYENMFRDPGGYFVDEARHRAPVHNFIFGAIEHNTDPYTASGNRIERFTVGSTALGGGYAIVSVPGRGSRNDPHHEWWFDEYAVDLTTGMASGEIRHTGWLGQPLGPASQMVWIGANPDAVANSDFETDLSGWNLASTVGSVLLLDPSTAGSGVVSARVTVPATGVVPYSTTLRTLGSIPVTQYQSYSATFWAKADRPRSAYVVAGRTSGGGSYGSRKFDLTTGWKRYQMVILANGTGTADLQFHLAGELGDVWLDDVHFQQGVTNLWRRDFQNGIVLVNPDAASMTVPLERPYRRIQGVTDPITNDGAIVTQITVPPSDARFLIGDDQIPPAAVNDLRPLPPGAP